MNNLQDLLKKTKEKIFSFQTKIKDFKKARPDITPVALPHSPFESAKKVVVEIAPVSVAKSTLVILLLLVVAYFLYQISGILVLFFVSFLLAAALDPVVDFLYQWKIPRSLGVVLIYLLTFVLLGFLISNLAPLIANQVFEIAQKVGDFVRDVAIGKVSDIPYAKQLKPYLDELYQAVDIQTAAAQVQKTLEILGKQLLDISFGLVNLSLILVLTFFMTVEEKALEQFYLSLFPSRYGKYISTRLEAVKEKIGYWLRGQFMLSLLATFLSYIGLLLLGVDYALTLSIIAGIMIVIPVIGRIFALILTIPIVLNQSPLLALWVTIYYFILQQLELNIISPYIMNRAVGLSPIVIIFAMLVGQHYLGILGLIISIPIATSIAIFVKDYTEKAK
jgi:predicted PurR-regulated permease PerM